MSTQTDWDYLMVTASNEAQAEAYRAQLARRRTSPIMGQVREVMVVADPEGRRVGSGGSTIYCLMQVVENELARDVAPAKTGQLEDILRGLRILIVHAGGDSRRLPAYGPCGKIFIPLPGGDENKEVMTLFDRLTPEFLHLPGGRPGEGQVVIAAGDALILFDASNVSLAFSGMTALTCPANPEHASKHGVFCPDASGQVRLYLQKPNVEQQRKTGAISHQGQTLLDIGIMSFDSKVALAMLKAFGIGINSEGKLGWSPSMRQAVFNRGVDFYREICCALGSEATREHHFQQTKGAGSSWSEGELAGIFQALAGIPFHLQRVPECKFLHFGTTKQLIQSGTELRQYDGAKGGVLSLNNLISGNGAIEGADSWVEGCRISAPLKLPGENVIVGLSVSEPMSVPRGACLDVLQGQMRITESRPGAEHVWFIRCYGITDTFKDSVEKGATFCGRELSEWLREVGMDVEGVWDNGIPLAQRSLWNARVFPAARENEGYWDWLWMFEPQKATTEQKAAFRNTERYSAAEIAMFADQESFFEWRRQNAKGL